MILKPDQLISLDPKDIKLNTAQNLERRCTLTLNDISRESLHGRKPAVHFSTVILSSYFTQSFRH